MAKIGFLLTEGPWQTENYKVFTKFATAAMDKGHEVQAFWYLDGVYNPIKHQQFPGTEEENLPISGMKVVVGKGAQIVACGICVNGRGLQGGKEFIEGVRVGGLPDFAELMGEVDTLVTL
jgi:tRNA 2-thiouridine synthesizing protein D